MFLLRWLWKNMKGNRVIYICALCLTVICQSMYIITPYLTQQIIDTFINNEHAAENLSLHTDLLIIMLIEMVAFTVLRAAIQYSANMMYETSSQGLIYRIRKILFKNIQAQDATFYDYYRTGDIMTRVSGDLDMVRHSVAWIIKTFLECIVLFGATAVYFFTIDWLMAICMLILTPLIFTITSRLKKHIGPQYVDLRERLSQMNTAAEENISGNRVVKAFAREDYEIEKFNEKNESYNKANIKASLTWLKFFPLLEIAAQSLMVIQLVFGGVFVLTGRLSLGEYAAFSGLIWTLSNPMRTLGNITNDFQRFTASANKIIELYYGKPKIVDRVDAVDLSNGRLKGKIEFKDVCFSYGKKEVLHNISFTVNAGETIAIMGETGCGKTSLINLIPRIYDANSGKITLDDIDIHMLKLSQLRGSIGMATQDVLLFSDTIDGNVSFGNPEMSEEDVVECAEAADANGFISRMEEGYDTIVGERGVGLSGGQKQRISLARAIAVKPSILILDDTTSAVDFETEKHIQRSLNNLDFSCTKIIIAQRISSTKNADKIIILQNGRIADIGTHEELISREGYYKEVYDLQK